MDTTVSSELKPPWCGSTSTSTFDRRKRNVSPSCTSTYSSPLQLQLAPTTKSPIKSHHGFNPRLRLRCHYVTSQCRRPRNIPILDALRSFNPSTANPPRNSWNLSTFRIPRGIGQSSDDTTADGRLFHNRINRFHGTRAATGSKDIDDPDTTGRRVLGRHDARPSHRVPPPQTSL